MRRVIAVVLAFGCSSPSPADDDDAPSCAEPPVLAVPIAIARSGEPLHWRADQCIDVTYAGLTAAQVADVEAAVAMWSDVGCESLCFAGPSESNASLEGADGRLHIAATTGFPAVSTMVYIHSTGRIRGVLIDLSALAFRRTLVRELGLNLGLAQPAPGVDSVLAHDAIATMPTARDTEALCTLYGRPPLCE